MSDVLKWRVAGDWFDVCKCAIPCPCTFAEAPTYGDCEGILAWHIRDGEYARAEALTGPTTPEGKRVQVHNPPGAEVGPGQIATWGRATTDRADGFGFKWEWDGRSSKHFPFDWQGP
jgi:hypothetical protein